MEYTDIAAVAAASGAASWIAIKVELKFHWRAIEKMQLEIKSLWESFQEIR